MINGRVEDSYEEYRRVMKERAEHRLRDMILISLSLTNIARFLRVVPFFSFFAPFIWGWQVVVPPYLWAYVAVIFALHFLAAIVLEIERVNRA